MRGPRELPRFWFDLTDPVGRATYLRHGVSLMALKYAVDTAVVYAVAGVWWTPLQYLSPFLLDRPELLRAGPSPLAWAMVLWTLPFLWIGVALTLRRALDAGLSPWTCLLFFVPFVNYATMLVLSVLPGGKRPPPSDVADVRGPARSALVGVMVGALVILGMVIRTDLAGGYGAALFLGTPFAVGVVTAFLYNEGGDRGLAATGRVVLLAVAIGAGAVLLFALEGVVCLVMALPLAAPLAFLGGVLGRRMALLGVPPGHTAAAALIALPLLAFPSVVLPEREPALREVVTAVEIDAPPSVVWRHVVGFSEIGEAPRLAFRLGIAYPVRASIDGEGVGAVRRCEFSTGAFVEPITVWDEGRRLAFDVVSQPPPLEEWSPYRGVHPPHLDGYFRSRRGEFRLVALEDGRTRLEGSTFYELDLHPQLYWHRWADALVHAIHRRVLRHVRAEAEGEAAAARGVSDAPGPPVGKMPSDPGRIHGDPGRTP